MRQRLTSFRMALGCVLVVFALAACTSGQTTDQASQATPSTTSEEENTPSATDTSTATLPAPCDLLTLTDAKTLLGDNIVNSGLGGPRRCEYETAYLTNYANVSVGIDYYDPTVPLYGEKVTGLDADQALWAASSSQLIVVKGDKILTFFAIAPEGKTPLEATEEAARLALSKL